MTANDTTRNPQTRTVPVPTPRQQRWATGSPRLIGVHNSRTHAVQLRLRGGR